MKYIEGTIMILQITLKKISSVISHNSNPDSMADILVA